MREHADWTDVLDVIERQIARQERAFERGEETETVVPVAPPTPMSERERVRASDLLQRTNDLLDRTLAAVRSGGGRSSSPYA